MKEELEKIVGILGMLILSDKVSLLEVSYLVQILEKVDQLIAIHQGRKR